MKKLTCLLLLLMTTGFVFAASQDLLNSYLEDDALVNIKALLDDASQSKNQASANYNLLILHYTEMTKAMNKMEAMIDDLQPAQRFQLANIYLGIGREEDAIKHYDFLNENYANWSCPWRHKGEAYYNLQEWEEAEKALNKAIETRVEHYDAYLWLARVQLKLNKNKEALKTFETGMSYKGKDTEDPEEEFSSQEEAFLKLDILKANKMKKESNKLEKSLRERFPECDYWKK